jgi:hypothetical protein
MVYKIYENDDGINIIIIIIISICIHLRKNN